MDMMNLEQLFSLEYIKQVIDRNAKSLIAAGALSVLLLGSYYYFRVYLVEQDARAHATLTEVLTEVSRAASKPDAWQDVEIAARTGYRQHSSSALAPYFLAIEADALVQQGKVAQGRDQLKSVVNCLPKNAPLNSLFALKLARLQLNAEAEAEQKQGLELLQSLAQDTTSVVHDEALYRLGSWYAQEKNTQQARQAFEQLVSLYNQDTDAVGQSVWAGLAKEQIDRLA